MHLLVLRPDSGEEEINMSIFAGTAAAAAKTTIKFHDTKHVATNILAVVWLPPLVPLFLPHSVPTLKQKEKLIVFGHFSKWPSRAILSKLAEKRAASASHDFLCWKKNSLDTTLIHKHTHTLTHVPYATPRLLVGDVVSSKFVENFYQYAEAMTWPHHSDTDINNKASGEAGVWAAQPQHGNSVDILVAHTMCAIHTNKLLVAWPPLLAFW